MNTCELKAFASKIRRVTCDMVLYRGDGHIGGALSMSDALAVLFGNYMKEECWVGLLDISPPPIPGNASYAAFFF